MSELSRRDLLKAAALLAVGPGAIRAAAAGEAAPEAATEAARAAARPAGGDDDLCFTPAVTLALEIRRKRVSPVEVVEAIFKRIHRLNPSLNAYCTLTEEAARLAAREAERAVMRGERLGPLHGVPVSIKDLIDTRGVRTMYGSKIREGYVPEDDAPAVARLKAAGAILLGKTATPEFGWKATTDSPLTGISRNPWNTARTCGGSSGGAGAAVAAGLGPLALGTDGGGSIRIPAAFNGVFGFKPSLGRVPQYPSSPAGFLVQTGPMARTVCDAALMLGVMVGPDERDLLSLPPDSTDYLEACERGVKGMRVAWSSTLGYATVHPEVARLTEAAARVFSEDLGCVVEPADPGFENPEESQRVFWTMAFGTGLRALLPQWESRMDPGLVVLVKQIDGLKASDCGEALSKRAALWDATRRLLEKYDLLLTPTVGIPAFDAGAGYPSEVAGKPVTRRGWFHTFPFNQTGQPAASVPCGFTAGGLPVGLQVVGRRFADAAVLSACAAFERARPWADRRPLA